MDQQKMAQLNKWIGIGSGAAVVAVIAIIISVFSFHKAIVLAEMPDDRSAAVDSADAGLVRAPPAIKAAPGKKPITGSIVNPLDDAFAINEPAAAHEFGGWEVTAMRGDKVLWVDHATNFLADEGEADLLGCFYRATNASAGVAGCPTGGFTWALLTSASSPAENSTWSSLSATECTDGSFPGYAAATKTFTRDATGWPTLDTVASGTGGCTESSCARVSTAQFTISVSGTWTGTASYIAIRGTTGPRLIAVAALGTPRTGLVSGDTLNLTYRQAMQ